MHAKLFCAPTPMMSSLPHELVSAIAEQADARTLARLRAASKNFKAAADNAVKRTPARKRPAGTPSYRKRTGKHQRLYNRIQDDIYALNDSMWKAMGHSGIANPFESDLMTPDPTPRVRHNPSLRNALHCQGLLLFVSAGLRAYRRGPRPDDFQEDDEFPRLLDSRSWTFF